MTDTTDFADRAPKRLVRPATPRPRTGIVHLGLGAFFRAFGCIYVSDAMAASGGDWGIVGVSLRRPDIRDALAPQDWAYTAVSLSPDGDVPRVVDILNEVLVAPEDPGAVLAAMADPDVKIVSLTVTEKGYCQDPATGNLLRDHPDIQHDLTNDQPKSALGFVLRALQVRHARGLRPFTVLSCDNLSQNGALLRGLVLEMAQRIDPELAAWIAAEARFPSTMVDRITPATTQADIERVHAMTGALDAAPVLHEPFGQWVIEDDFVDGVRPDLAQVGVQFVPDVSGFEHMKLRMLNGSHSAIAYLGYLAGHKTISDAVSAPVFARFVRVLWGEVIPTVDAPPGVDLARYADQLFARYANPMIQHQTWQIAADGSQKLPPRILESLREAMQAGRDAPALCLTVAAWMRYVSGVDEAGQTIDVRDPLAQDLAALVKTAQLPGDNVAALLSVAAVFPKEMVDGIRGPVSAAATALWGGGARQTMAEILDAQENG